MIVCVVMVTAIGSCLVGRVLLPEWREHCIQRALDAPTELPFWWPPSWREEYWERKTNLLEMQDLEWHRNRVRPFDDNHS
jgi:hypothetical protein